MPQLRPKARIIRTIGDQLISGPEAALIELVKNAYDADSPTVRIVIEPAATPVDTVELPLEGDATAGSQIDDHAAAGNLSAGNTSSEEAGRTGGCISVTDCGHGMTAEALVGKWFEPATTDKVNRRVSPGERKMLGAKGVGRFATARLGDRLFLTTTAELSTGAIERSDIYVDWTAFEKAEYLDQVSIGVNTKILADRPQLGVRLEIYGLRDTWTRPQLERLVRELRRMATAQASSGQGFRIFLDITAFKDDTHGFDGASLIAGAFGALQDTEKNSTEELRDPTEIHPFDLDNIYHYRLDGKFDENGAFSGNFRNQRGDGIAIPLGLPESKLEAEELTCGGVDISINIYDRESDAITDLFERMGLGSVGRVDARRILDENIGIGIYRNGFRIRPYGDAETDWLELESRRVQDPSRKLGLNQVWGIVNIEHEDISGLIERSSREGLEHNGAFQRLKRLLTNVIVLAESLRVDFREMTGISRKPEGDTDSVRAKARLNATTRAVESLPEGYRKKIERALKQERAALNSAIEELEAYQQKLAAQSSLGLVISQVLHDGRRYLGDINTRSKNLADGGPRIMEDSTFGRHFRETFGKNAESIYGSATGLVKLFHLLDPLSARKRGRPKVLSILEVIQKCMELMQDAIRTAGIHLIISSPPDLDSVTVYEADLMAAILNIVDNAIHWLGTVGHDRELTVSITQSKKWTRIAIRNNGPLIDRLFQKNLFNPGFTLKAEGTGLGLAIAREAMRASKGNVTYDAEADMTTFIIEISRGQGGVK